MVINNERLKWLIEEIYMAGYEDGRDGEEIVYDFIQHIKNQIEKGEDIRI